MWPCRNPRYRRGLYVGIFFSGHSGLSPFGPSRNSDISLCHTCCLRPVRGRLANWGALTTKCRTITACPPNNRPEGLLLPFDMGGSIVLASRGSGTTVWWSDFGTARAAGFSLLTMIRRDPIVALVSLYGEGPKEVDHCSLYMCCVLIY